MTLPARSVTFRAGTRSAQRLAFLDALRGIAVGLVLLQHVGELLVPAVRQIATSAVQLGQLGVIVFFLCSGFIVPASLERGSGSRGVRVRSFWRSRFFRLYPMYWLSLGAALLLVAAGRYTPAGGVDAGAWLVNAAMVQGLVGRPDVIGVYWSLAFELIFYLAVSLLFVLGLQRRSALLSLTASAASAALAVAGALLGRHVPLGVFCVVTMFAGTVVHHWHTGTVRLRTLVLCLAAALASGTTLLAAMLLGQDDPTSLGTRSFVPMLCAWFGAYGVFCLALLLRENRFPRVLVRLGVVSYAVYLLHPLVLAAVPRVGGPVITALAWTGLTVASSEICHRFVELPAIRLGRRLASASTPSATGAREAAPQPVPAEALAA